MAFLVYIRTEKLSEMKNFRIKRNYGIFHNFDQIKVNLRKYILVKMIYINDKNIMIKIKRKRSIKL